MSIETLCKQLADSAVEIKALKVEIGLIKIALEDKIKLLKQADHHISRLESEYWSLGD